MQASEEEINYYVELAQKSENREKRNQAMEFIMEKLKPFRFALAKKFSNKGVEFDDITQHIDLKLIEAIYDYDRSKDPSALRHLVSKARNGMWNYYRKEMNYFDEAKSTVSLDSIYQNEEGIESSYYDIVDESTVTTNNVRNISFDEDAIIDKILLVEELNKLTFHQQEVLFMYFLDDMTQYNIAEALEINQANVSRAK